MIKNKANQPVATQIVDKATGDPYSGTVNLYAENDGGSQVLLGACNNNGNGSFGRILSAAESNYNHIALTWDSSGGVNITLNFYPTLQDTLTIETADSTSTIVLSSYANASEADDYFKNQCVGRDEWFNVASDKKDASLLQSTRLINNLSFLGKKTDSTQTNEFPRNGDLIVPQKIKYATFEIAYNLATDIRDPDIDFARIPIIADDKGSFKVKKDPNLIPHSIIHGIPSEVAWTYLKPYLIRQDIIRFYRI